MTPEISKPTKGICVDGGTVGNPGPCFYRGVDLETGQIIFEKHLGPGTNNVAEFLGLPMPKEYRLLIEKINQNLI